MAFGSSPAGRKVGPGPTCYHTVHSLLSVPVHVGLLRGGVWRNPRAWVPAAAPRTGRKKCPDPRATAQLPVSCHTAGRPGGRHPWRGDARSCARAPRAALWCSRLLA
eukprot:4092797-Prymnesium_polylepis.1